MDDYPWEDRGPGIDCREFVPPFEFEYTLKKASSTKERVCLVEYAEEQPLLLQGFFDGVCTDTAVGIRLLKNGKLVNVACPDGVIIRECATCVSTVVECDIFPDIPNGKTLYWCEVDNNSNQGHFWEIATSYKSGHLQPRIHMLLDVFKDTRICPQEHPLASKICSKEKTDVKKFLDIYRDKDRSGVPKFNEVVISLYTLSHFFAHDEVVSGILQEFEQMLRYYESTNVNAFFDMLRSGAESNLSPSLKFLKIARDCLSTEEMNQCELLLERYWKHKRTEFKKHRDKITKALDKKLGFSDNAEEPEDDVSTEKDKTVDTADPYELKGMLITALFTEEYLALEEMREFDGSVIIDILKDATSKIQESDYLCEDIFAGKFSAFVDYTNDNMIQSDTFQKLSKDQEKYRARASKLKTDRASAQIQYSRIFLLGSPCKLVLPGYVLNGIHRPVTHFNMFHNAPEKKRRKKS